MIHFQKKCRQGMTLGENSMKRAFFMVILLADDHNICKLMMSVFSYIEQWIGKRKRRLPS